MYCLLAFSILLAISPLVPLAFVVVLGGGIVAAYKLLKGDAEPTPPGPTPPGPAPTPPGPAPGPSPGPSPGPGPGDSLKCSATGEKYDPVVFSDPNAVAGVLIRLGYYVGNTLVTPADVEWIKKAQRTFRDRKIGPYAKAKDSWIHGRSGPCFLVSLGKANAQFLAGTWGGP
jgi:hypothetical protein